MNAANGKNAKLMTKTWCVRTQTVDIRQKKGKKSKKLHVK